MLAVSYLGYILAMMPRYLSDFISVNGRDHR